MFDDDPYEELGNDNGDTDPQLNDRLDDIDLAGDLENMNADDLNYG